MKKHEINQGFAQERRNYPMQCPKCGSRFLLLEDGKVVCCVTACGWEIEAKRASDIELPDFHKTAGDML